MNKIRTNGIIDKVIYGETGNVMYYVNTDVNGETIRVQSLYYSSKTKSLPEGKEVVVDYMVSPKGNRLVEILDENIVPCRDDLSGELKTLALFGIIVVIIICVFIVKNFI